MALGGGVVKAEGLGDDRCRGLEDELVQCGQAAGNGGDAEVADERADRAGSQRLTGAASGEQPAGVAVGGGAHVGALVT
ncbi:hypothetical protein D7223_24290 [Micromonospora endolithica]|uniref:Uncharacterized protein n=1 Tax=Micromonospora endolithica TaxID=230091 RepID=A0A3A9Z2H4_9ACTN|nr:hypothetical protein D7223_24290 [Micromonospora endolithica]